MASSIMVMIDKTGLLGNMNLFRLQKPENIGPFLLF